MYRAILVLALIAASAAPAATAELSVALHTPDGRPVADAVVSYAPAGGTQPPKPAGEYEMVQQHIQFHPFVLIVPVGADVTFPNRDRVRHHVYSFSQAKRFELKLYGHEQPPTVHFDKAGIVPLGCNIHDQMSAYIDVVDTPYAAKSGADGTAALTSLPAGRGVLTIWQPYLKAPRNLQTYALTLPAAGEVRQSYALDLRAAPGGMDMGR